MDTAACGHVQHGAHCVLAWQKKKVSRRVKSTGASLRSKSKGKKVSPPVTRAVPRACQLVSDVPSVVQKGK